MQNQFNERVTFYFASKVKLHNTNLELMNRPKLLYIIYVLQVPRDLEVKAQSH